MTMTMTADYRLFQLEASDFIIEHQRTILGLPPGTGKTRILIRMIEHYNPDRLVIVASRIALKTWRTEWVKWGLIDLLPTPTLTIGKNPGQRQKIWEEARVIGTTFNALALDTQSKRNAKLRAIIRKQYFPMVIGDEAHRCNNRQKTFFAGVKEISKFSKVVCLATGSPGKGGPSRFWGLLHLARPLDYTSHWRFINKYCMTDKNPWGGTEILGVYDQDKMVNDLKDTFYFRSKEAVAPEMPKKIRQKMPFELTPAVRRVYDQLKEDLLAILEEDMLVAPNTLAATIKLRQLLCCPKILSDELPLGSAIEDVVEFMQDNEEHVVIFVPFKPALQFFKGYLQSKGYEDIFIIQGGMELDEMQRREDAFKRTRGIMLCTVQVAESFSLETCDTAHFIGADWDPDANIQAEDRINRLTSEFEYSKYYYWAAEGTVDDSLFLGLDEKHDFISSLAKSSDRLREALKKR